MKPAHCNLHDYKYNKVYPIITMYQYIKILVVCVSVCVCVRDGCRRGRNEFAVRVQNHHVRFSFHRNGHYLSCDSKSCCRSGHSALQATRRMPLWALAIALATGKNTKLFGVLDQNENGFFTYMSQRAGSKAATVVTSD